MYIYIYIYIYSYIYIYRERERDTHIYIYRERERNIHISEPGAASDHALQQAHAQPARQPPGTGAPPPSDRMCVYIYIYIYIYHGEHSIAPLKPLKWQISHDISWIDLFNYQLIV